MAKDTPDFIDINNPKHGNLIVSPDNLHTDPTPDVVNPDEYPVDEE